MTQIDRIRLTAVAKNQLITLKRKTGINHYNTLCRYAFCLSLANETVPPMEIFNFNGGIDIDWRTFTGGNEALYFNILLMRHQLDEMSNDEISLKNTLATHLHRGLSFMAGMSESEVLQKFKLVQHK